LPGRIIAPSPDVVVLGAGNERETEAPQDAPFRLDNQVQLILGEKVNVNAVGLVGRIAGDVTFTNHPGDKDLIPTADGSLSIKDGTFRAFGQDLDIETGRVIFAGVPVTQPEISVRAVRWIDNDTQVTAAGVMVTGSLSQPSLELFSRPALDATEVQSYLLTGRPSGGRDSVLSIGTYLNPKLYVGYGYNLLEETNEFNSLYTITPRYGVEASVGEADNNLNLTFTLER
jgi:autotransporter translocation and assembly factor TamB